MARDGLADNPMIAAGKALLADLSDLLRKEIRLAKAEITVGVAAKAKGGAFMAIAGIVGFVGVLVLIEAAIFAIAAAGLALYWAALIVAIVLFAAAGGLFFYGRGLTATPIAPERSINQINADISAVREQLS